MKISLGPFPPVFIRGFAFQELEKALKANQSGDRPSGGEPTQNSPTRSASTPPRTEPQQTPGDDSESTEVWVLGGVCIK